MTSKKDAGRTVLIVGAGPGVGLAVARRFSRDGGPVGLVARSPDALTLLAQTLRDEGTTVAWRAADATDQEGLRRAIRQLAEQLGPIEVLCFSPLPSVELIRPVLQTAPQDYLGSLALNVGGAAVAVGEVAPSMLARGHGSLLFTTGGGALHPSPERAASAVTTTAETVYIDLLHRALAPQGVRVAQLAVVGPVGPGALHEPDDVAEALWVAHRAGGGPLTVLDHEPHERNTP